MEGCLLCLEINKDFLDCIPADSIQWQELKIRKLIEKHFWVMESWLPNSCLCNTCWLALYDFHKFYIRIEEAHLDFGKLMKSDIELELHDNNEKLKNNFINDKINHNEDGKEIFLNEVIDDVDQFDKDHTKHFMKLNHINDYDKNNDTLMQKRKRRNKSIICSKNIETVQQDPLTNRNHVMSSLSKNNKPLESSKNPQTCTESFENSNITDDLLSDNNDNEKFLNMQTLDPLPTASKPNILLNFSESDNSFTDSDYEPLLEVTKRDKKCKKNSKPRKRDRSKPQAKDIFLAENFEMTCILCKMPMASFKSLVKHFEMDHQCRGYASCCNKKFYKRSLLLEHVQSHVDPNVFKCNQCGKVLSTRKVLKTHQLMHLSEEEKKFACNECGKNFAEQYLLSNHIRSVHLKKYVKICDICGKTLRCSEIFERHMSEHKGKAIPPVNCEICGLLLSHKKALKRHVDILHPVGGQQSHTCEICFKVSPNIVALKKHIRCTHNTGNIHKCTICGRGFKRSQTLRDHVATHTGKALYTCPWCPKTFNSNGCMHAHRKKHHPREWEEAHRQKYSQSYNVPVVINTKTLIYDKCKKS